MTRSGYTEGFDSQEEQLAYGRWRGQVASALRGRRGQAFLREMIAALDAMPVRELTTDVLVTEDGRCCALGAVCRARNIQVLDDEVYDADEAASVLGIARQIAAEVMFINDEACSYGGPGLRWKDMRAWAEEHLRDGGRAPEEASCVR